MAFVFEHVKESEADKVLSLYRSLVGTPFCAWTADYPARSDVEFDLSRNALFCLRDKETGEMAGVISIDQDPKVESLTCWTPELQPGRELSRLGVREAYQNQGIARRLMAGAMEELRRQGFKSVHILVAKENKKALASYKIFEYETVGACFLHRLLYIFIFRIFHRTQPDHWHVLFLCLFRLPLKLRLWLTGCGPGIQTERFLSLS